MSACKQVSEVIKNKNTGKGVGACKQAREVIKKLKKSKNGGRHERMEASDGSNKK